MWKPEVGEFVWYASNSRKWPRNRSVYRVKVMSYNEETGKYDVCKCGSVSRFTVSPDTLYSTLENAKAIVATRVDAPDTDAIAYEWVSLGARLIRKRN